MRCQDAALSTSAGCACHSASASWACAISFVWEFPYGYVGSGSSTLTTTGRGNTSSSPKTRRSARSSGHLPLVSLAMAIPAASGPITGSTDSVWPSLHRRSLPSCPNDAGKPALWRTACIFALVPRTSKGHLAPLWLFSTWSSGVVSATSPSPPLLTPSAGGGRLRAYILSSPAMMPSFLVPPRRRTPS